MILFCDTSALVKLYVREEGTDALTAAAAVADVVAVCRIAWVEMMSAMARRAREQTGDEAAMIEARQRFIADWPRYLVFEVTQELVQLAGDNAGAFGLRAYDSVQLAAAQIAHLELPDEVRSACFDMRLVNAARGLGIQSV